MNGRKIKWFTTYPSAESKALVSKVILYKPPPVASGCVGSTNVPTSVGSPTWSTTENLPKEHHTRCELTQGEVGGLLLNS